MTDRSSRIGRGYATVALGELQAYMRVCDTWVRELIGESVDRLWREDSANDLFAAVLHQFYLHVRDHVSLDRHVLAGEAFIYALAMLAGNEQRVSGAQVKEVYGDEAYALFRLLAGDATNMPVRLNARPFRMQYGALGVEGLDNVRPSRDLDLYQDRMTWLTDVFDALGDETTLKDKVVAHFGLLGQTTVGFHDLFQRWGLDWSNLHEDSKPHNNNASAAAALSARGADVSPFSLLGTFPRNPDVEQTIHDLAVTRLRKLFAGRSPGELKGRAFILFGGPLIRALHAPEHRREFGPWIPHCTGIAETARETDKLREMEKRGELRIPVVDLGRAPFAKQLSESLDIGESVVFHTERALERAADGWPLTQPRHAAVIGWGPIGQAVTAALTRRDYRSIWPVDISPYALRYLAQPEVRLDARIRIHPDFVRGRTTVDEIRRYALERADILFFCAPAQSIAASEWDLGHRSKVAVMAASNRVGTEGARLGRRRVEEYDQSGGAWTYFQGRRIYTGDIVAGMQRRHVVDVTEQGTEILHVANGFMVNGEYGLPPEAAAKLYAAKAAAIKQAVEEVEPGVHRFKYDRALVELAGPTKYESPDHRKLEPWGGMEDENVRRPTSSQPAPA